MAANSGPHFATASIASESQAQGQRLTSLASADALLPVSPFAGVRWTLIYIGFIAYAFAAITYRLPIGDVAMGTALVGLVLQRDKLRLAPLLAWLGLFLAWCALGYVQTEFRNPVWARLLVLGKLWIITLVALNALRTRPQVRFFIIFALGCFALFPVRGAYYNYFVAGYTRFDRAIWNYIYENPNDLAALCLLQLSLIAGLLITEPKGLVRYLAFAGSGVLTLLILMTQSRGAIVALIIVAGIAFFAQRKRLRAMFDARKRRRMAIALTAVVVASAIAAPKAVWERLSGLRFASNTQRLGEVDPEGSARARFEIWKVVMRVVVQQPIMGVGIGAYPHAHLSTTRLGGRKDPFEEMRTTCIQSRPSTVEKGVTVERVVLCNELPDAKGFRDPHSTYLHVLAETGIVGLIIFLALFITTIVSAERIRKRCRSVLPRESMQLLYLELGLLAFFLAGIFASFTHVSFLYIHLVLIWATALALRSDYSAIRRAPRLAT